MKENQEGTRVINDMVVCHKTSWKSMQEFTGLFEKQTI